MSALNLMHTRACSPVSRGYNLRLRLRTNQSKSLPTEQKLAELIVRKKYTLTCFRNVLVRFPQALVELLSMDARVCIHFIISLLDMLRNVEDSVTLDLVIEVLALLTVELKSEQFVCCVLDECQKQLSEKNSMRRSLPIFTLLGKLLLTIPFLAEKLLQEYTKVKDMAASRQRPAPRFSDASLQVLLQAIR
ncbi:meiosis inhibitor protein 1-like, partial [Heterodontus francisci]|uniref:meiosis inhibitor protein 1-like n=1 Tax=Heterodontus francisci TaxID=7792 RepID=UPI00355B213E